MLWSHMRMHLALSTSEQFPLQKDPMIEFSVNMAWIWGNISKNISPNPGRFDLPVYLGWKYVMLCVMYGNLHEFYRVL